MADTPSAEEGGPEVLAQAEPEEQSISIELGDTVQIVGGTYNGLIAVIYGLYPDRLTLQAIGHTTRLEHLDMIESEEYTGPDKEKYGEIESIQLVEKATKPGFVNLVDMQVGSFVEAFLEGKLYAEYEIVGVDEEADTVTLKPDSGDTFTIPFEFQGIPRDLPFDFLRIKELRSTPANQNEGNPDAQQATAPVGEVDDENVIAGFGDLSDEEGEGDALDIVFGETIQLEVQEAVKQLSSADRIYPDIFQRSEMLAHLIRQLPEAKQRDPNALQQVRRMVELMMILRNDVVR